VTVVVEVTVASLTVSVIFWVSVDPPSLTPTSRSTVPVNPETGVTLNEPVAFDAVLVVSFRALGFASCRMVDDAGTVLAGFDDLVRVGDRPVAFTQRAGRDDTVGGELKRATTDVGPQAAIRQGLLDTFGAPAAEQCRIGWPVDGLGTERSETHPCQGKPTDGAQCGRIRSHSRMMPKIGPPFGVALRRKPVTGAPVFSLT
jgi:hypothetical protein